MIHLNAMPASNQEIARVMEDIANLLEIQHANPFKVRAYRSAAAMVRKYERPLYKMVESGDGQALQDLPGIGESLAALVEEYVKTGKSQLLQRLKGAVSPEEVFEQVPGVGKGLARQIAETLDVKTLEDLELAAHDGRLSKLRGFGRRRIEAIRASLAGMLSGFIRRRQQRFAQEEGRAVEPPIEGLLEVDAEYRRKAASQQLKKIAPKRFNPGKVAWLPVLHKDIGDWSYTAMFSNTARAHELDKTGDWVVLYFEKNGFEGQSTVVTETSGTMAGRRVVRGREQACRDLYFSGPHH